MRKKIIASILSAALLTGTASASQWGTPEAEDWSSARFTTKFAVAEDEYLQEVGVLALDKNAMLINGAIRYIDDDNLNKTPRLIEARTYLPLPAAELLLKLYTEVSEDKAYVDIRYNDIEISDGTNAHYLWTVKNERNELVLDGKNADFNGNTEQNEYLIYIDGEPYVALRKLSEKIGKKVKYDDGYILIGDTDKVDAVTEAVMKRARTLLSDYTPADEGKTLYVSVNASSRGNGTLKNPYSLKDAQRAAEPGDTVILRGGTYREMLDPLNDGTASQPIVYKAYEGEKVIISALEEVGGFTADEQNPELVSADAVAPSNIFDSTRPTEGRYQVFYKGKNIPEARYPNIDTTEYEIDDISPLFPTKGDIKIVESEKNAEDKFVPTYKAVSETLLQGDEENKWVGATLVTLHGAAWCTSTAKVKASGDGWLELDEDSATKRWWFAQEARDEDAEELSEASKTAQWGYLTGHRAAIDLPGEWVVEDGKIVMKLPDGASTGSLKIEMKARQLCINLTDKKYIHIDGIETIGGGVTMNNTEHCIIKNCKMSYISHYTQSIDQREAYIDTPYVSGQQPCEENGAPQRGEVGIYMGGKNDVLRDCTIDTSAGAAVYMTGSYTYIHNNNMLNCGYMGSTVGGIYISAVGHTPYNDAEHGELGFRNERGGYVITNNRVRNIARSALTVQPPEYGWKTCQRFAVYMPCDISYNEFSNGGIASCDTGVVYLTGATMGTKDNQSLFHHNIVWVDAPVAGNFVGMVYYDSQVYEMSNYDNIFFRTKNIGVVCEETNKIWDDSIFVCATEGFYTYSVIGKTDNKNLKYFAGGTDGLTASDYPGGKVFITGIRE